MIKILMVAKASQSSNTRLVRSPTHAHMDSLAGEWSWVSLSSRSLSFLLRDFSLLLLLLLETVHQESISFVDLSSEVLVVRKQLLEVDSIFIQKHASNSWSILFPVSLLDDCINVVSDKVVSVWTLKLFQLRNIDLRKSDLRKVDCWSLVSGLLRSLVACNLLPLWLNVLLLIRLVLILVEASTSLTSATASLASSSWSVVEFVVSSVESHAVMLIVASHLIRIGPLLHFVLNVVDEFFDLVNVFFFIFMNQVELGLPELNLQRSETKSEWVGLVEHLNALLGLLHFFIADVPNFAGHFSGVTWSNSIFELQWNNLSSLAQLVSEFVLFDLLWNVSDENVGLESLLHGLTNLGFFLLSATVVRVADELRDENDSSVYLLLGIQSFNSCLGLIVSLELHESHISVFGLLGNTVDLSKWSEEFSDLIFCEFRWDVFNKEICKVFLSVFSLVFLWVNNDVNFFSLLSGVVESLNGGKGILLLFVLNVTKASANVVLIDFEFAWDNFSKWKAETVQFILGEVAFSWQVFEKDVGLQVEILSLLLVENDLLSIERLVILLSQTSLSFILSIEVEVPIAFGLSGFIIEHDLGISEVVSSVFEELE